MVKKVSTFILSLMLVSGCAARSYQTLGVSHMGGQRLVGVVSQKSANEFDEFVRRFHDHLSQKQYDKAYDMFSDELKIYVALDKFKEDQASLDRDFGQEQDFIALFYKAVSYLPKFDEALFQDAFTYYESVIGAYQSARDKKAIVYEFNVIRKNGALMIAGLNYGPCAEECGE